jgi:hypothetical protein
MRSRRDFIQGVVASGVVLVAPRTVCSAESRIEVLPAEAIGTISPNLYGHFVEHLGGVVYDGIWVGEGSRVPNIGGLRRALVEHMRRIKPGVVRSPVGCFADSSHRPRHPRPQQLRRSPRVGARERAGDGAGRAARPSLPRGVRDPLAADAGLRVGDVPAAAPDGGPIDRRRRRHQPDP